MGRAGAIRSISEPEGSFLAVTLYFPRTFGILSVGDGGSAGESVRPCRMSATGGVCSYGRNPPR